MTAEQRYDLNFDSDYEQMKRANRALMEAVDVYVSYDPHGFLKRMRAEHQRRLEVARERLY